MTCSNTAFGRVAGAILLGLMTVACGQHATSPTPAVASPQTQSLDRAAVLDALNYWQTAAGITYVLIETNDEPRLLVRPGTDGLAAQGGGRALIDGTYTADNRARSGLVVFEPGGGTYCRSSPLWNMNAQGGASYRQLDTITRWQLPVRVYLQQ